MNYKILHITMILILLAGCTGCKISSNQESLPKQESMTGDKTSNKSDQTEMATFAAGCFWGVEYKFRQLKGVLSTMAGYTGGNLKNPTYKQVCSDETDHAEAVQIIYDPSFISYEELLEFFLNIHNPTQLNRQGPDVGTQYRSAIFYHNEKQKKAAEKAIEQLNKSSRFKKPVVTEIVPAVEFYKAEEYHQQYLEKRVKSK